MTIQKTFRIILSGAGLVALAYLAGCASKDQKAVNQAKAQATSTNVPQQVQYVDSDGNTVTKTVEPPAAQGQQPAISTLITPPPPGPKPHSTDPVITPLPSAAQGAPPPARNGQRLADALCRRSARLASPASRPPSPSAFLQARSSPSASISASALATSHAGDRFNGNVVDPVLSNGTVVIPHGTPVTGRVVEAHHGGHFRGRSILELRLTGMTLNGYEYPLDTHDTVRSRRGKGRRSAGIIGGMTGAGMLIGGIATGGVGLAIGAAAGAGSGTAIAGGTGNHNLDIPAESIVHFRLADPLVVQNP